MKAKIQLKIPFSRSWLSLIFFILYSTLCLVPLIVMMQGKVLEDMEIPLILWSLWLIWLYRLLKSWSSMQVITLENHQLTVERQGYFSQGTTTERA